MALASVLKNRVESSVRGTSERSAFEAEGAEGRVSSVGAVWV